MTTQVARDVDNFADKEQRRGIFLLAIVRLDNSSVSTPPAVTSGLFVALGAHGLDRPFMNPILCLLQRS